MAAPRVLIQTADFNLADEAAALRAGDKRVGAICAFVGTVRDRNDGAQVATLELEHYPGMTERSIAGIIDQARQRWNLLDVCVIHRIGRLHVGDRIVFVGIASRHRGDAFAACEFVMDYLKTRAPFWKKEWNAYDQASWVDARESDYGAAARWESG